MLSYFGTRKIVGMKKIGTLRDIKGIAALEKIIIHREMIKKITLVYFDLFNVIVF